MRRESRSGLRSWQVSEQYVSRLFLGETFVKRILLSSVAFFAFAAAGHAEDLSGLAQSNAPVRLANPADAMAADLPYKAPVKAPAPVNDDICWHGICLYGNFDMGVTYNQHGNPLTTYETPNYLVERGSNGSYFGAAPNAMSSSFIGLRGKQEVADNLFAVFNLQTIFIPSSGMNMNGLGALAQNNGLGAAPQYQNVNSYGDTSKAGQMFNNAAYFGISSPTYGTFTMGRQSALSSDNVVNYDPLSGAGAFSAITFEGLSGGGGDTEDRIWDNSYEYRLNVGPVRLAAEAQLGNGGNSSTGNAFQGDIGFDYMGLSMDFLGGKTQDALSLADTLSSAQVGLITAQGIGCSMGCVGGIVSDNTVFQLAAKYTIGPWKLFGGYENVRFANPDNPLAPGAFALGGYNIGAPNNGFYQTDRIMNVFWVGARYAITRDLDITGAYYGYRQNSFVAGGGTPAGSLVNPTPAGVLGAVSNPGGDCTTSISPGCSGAMDMGSIVLDWRFARHVDLYAGVSYIQKTGGLASGYNLTYSNMNVAATANTFNKVSTYDPTIGLRYQF